MKKRDTLFLPCGHVTSCGDCALNTESCSICGAEVITKVKVRGVVSVEGKRFREMNEEVEGKMREGRGLQSTACGDEVMGVPGIMTYIVSPGRLRSAWCVQRWMLVFFSSLACT